MAYFSYAEADDVKKVIKGDVEGWRLELLEQTLHNASSRLSGYFPTLKPIWLEEEEGSPIRDLAEMMVSEAARKIVANPDGVSSETMGPYAYSRFDSEDAGSGWFSKADLEALEALLAERGVQRVGSIKVSPAVLPAAPMPRPGKFTNSRRNRWKRY